MLLFLFPFPLFLCLQFFFSHFLHQLIFIFLHFLLNLIFFFLLQLFYLQLIVKQDSLRLFFTQPWVFFLFQFQLNLLQFIFINLLPPFIFVSFVFPLTSLFLFQSRQKDLFLLKEFHLIQDQIHFYLIVHQWYLIRFLLNLKTQQFQIHFYLYFQFFILLNLYHRFFLLYFSSSIFFSNFKKVFKILLLFFLQLQHLFLIVEVHHHQIRFQNLSFIKIQT